MKTPKSAIAFLVVACLTVTQGFLGQTTSNGNAKPVVVLCGGDDGLTLRLRDASEHAFNATSDLPPATKERHAIYKVVIPTNVDWKQVGSRTKVLYTIEVSTMDDKKVGTFKGPCWDSSIRRCATQIVDETRELLTTINEPK